MERFSICKICGKKKATPSHVRTHGLSYMEYKMKYKDKKVRSEEEYQDMIFQWMVEGYNVEPLMAKMGKKGFEEEFERINKIIEELKSIKRELDEITIEGLEEDILELRKIIKDPYRIDDVEEKFKELKRKIRERFFISMVQRGVKVIEAQKGGVVGEGNQGVVEAERVSIPVEGKGGVEISGEGKEEIFAGEKKVPVKIEWGTAYLIEEDKPKMSFSIFKSLLSDDVKGLCISREYPDKIKKKYGLDDVPMFWLSATDSEYSIHPTEMGKLLYSVEKFLKSCTEQNFKPVILLSGLEYLITQNNYGSVLKFLQLLNEQITIHDSVLIVPISPSTLDKSALKMIEREMEVVKG
ncbi:MAG: hypothetical protein DRN20_03385 [Thermoplasmata archaeon]|nr:MAG: hypothetical protein DRN20_03385 [Thermoplasmata archaeon]